METFKFPEQPSYLFKLKLPLSICLIDGEGLNGYFSFYLRETLGFSLIEMKMGSNESLFLAPVKVFSLNVSGEK
jgi:hypothetical protein